MRFFNTSICDDCCTIVVYLRCPEGKVKALEMLVKVLIRERRGGMKANSTREMIDYPRSRGKKRIKGVEAVSDAVELLIDILDRAFEVGLLFHSEFRSCGLVGSLILSVLRI